MEHLHTVHLRQCCYHVICNVINTYNVNSSVNFPVPGYTYNVDSSVNFPLPECLEISLSVMSVLKFMYQSRGGFLVPGNTYNFLILYWVHLWQIDSLCNVDSSVNLLVL